MSEGNASSGSAPSTQRKSDFLSKAQVEHFRCAFSVFDKDGSGSVSVHELANVMRCLGQDLTDDEVRRMFAEVDTDGSNEIDFDEFLDLIAAHLEATGAQTNGGDDLTRENWAQCFHVFDVDLDGFISTADLGTVLRNMGESLTPMELEEMIAEASSATHFGDDSYKLSPDDFIKVMMYGIDKASPDDTSTQTNS